MYDAIIIGAGVIGCSVAYSLVRYTANIAVIDRAHDVSEGASKANSGIVHAGHDAEIGSNKAHFNVKGAAMYPELCKRLGVPYQKSGALVIGFCEEDRRHLEMLKEQGDQNGVPGCRVIEQDEIFAMEPNLNPDVKYALYVPSSGLVSPYELTCALADSAAENGAEFILDTRVDGLKKTEEGWLVETSRGNYHAKAVINCAGVGADKLHNGISTKMTSIVPRRGQYYLLDREQPPKFLRTIFQVPGPMGKGVLVSPTTHGNLLLGPTAEDLTDGLDTGTTRQGLDEVLAKVQRTWPSWSIRTVITTFSGVRAHEKGNDFIIGPVEGAPEGAFEAIGIESPGLSAAPAIGEELGQMAANYLQLKERTDYREPTPLPKPFSHMTDEERTEAFARDPHYGRIVCRCEQVTEAEIRHAIHRPVGARSLDGVKRRTRAGMGRCQSGFCMTRVVELLSEETQQDLIRITKSGGESRLLVGSLTDTAREVEDDE